MATTFDPRQMAKRNTGEGSLAASQARLRPVAADIDLAYANSGPVTTLTESPEERRDRETGYRNVR